jgi:hypothetical protein
MQLQRKTSINQEDSMHLGKNKIVISSPEVHFGIKRQYAEVRRKNLLIFSYKNHLDRFCIKRKQFI